MGKMERVKEASQKIVNALKQIPIEVSIKIGAEIDLIPKPVLRFFTEIHVLHKLIRKKREKKNADREEGGKRLHHDDEGASQRNST